MGAFFGAVAFLAALDLTFAAVVLDFPAAVAFAFAEVFLAAGRPPPPPDR